MTYYYAKKTRLFMICPKNNRIRLRYSFSLRGLPCQSEILVSLVCLGRNESRCEGRRRDGWREGEKEERRE